MAIQVRDVGAIIISGFTGLLTVWWLYLVQLGQAPIIQNGNVILDEFQRAKDILIVVLPLFSASVAYWLGSREVAEAKNEMVKARQETAVADQKLKALLEQGPWVRGTGIGSVSTTRALLRSTSRGARRRAINTRARC